MDIPRGIKLRHLEAFLAVAELQAISAAARRQNISQPALSKTIAELEMLLGTSLFDRAGRRTLLSAAGETFREYALNALQNLEAGCQALAGKASGSSLSVGLLPTVAGGFFPLVALNFARQSEDARISVITGPHNYLMEQLRAGRIDLMVGRMPSARDMSGLQFEYLYEEPILLVGRAGHPGEGDDATTAARRFPLILPNAGAIIREPVDDFLTAIGLTRRDPSFETVSLPFARYLLEHSDMVWFISRGVVARELENGELISFPFGDHDMAGAVGLTMRSSPANAHIERLTRLLHRRANESAAPAGPSTTTRL